MNRLIRISPIALLALAVTLSTAGCKSNQDQSQNAGTAPTDSSADPASANLAPASAASTDQSSAASTGSTASTAPVEDASYGAEPVVTAPEPPPALPVYQQPVDPGDGYIWTPGYWNYASAGYYWVPGVWVQAPYQGALWTPGYWGWTNHHYGFFHGYWGPHIGFYGGINYGFGYVGTGYQGGYWNSGHFFYNRTVNNINVNVVHNVYEYRVQEPSIHIAFNGGPGGITVRPRPAELVAFREPHAPPMSTQVEIEHTASTNRGNFVSENHGRPASAVIEKPVMADREVHPVAGPAPRMAPEPHPAPVEARPAVRPEAHPAPEARPAARPEAHPAPQMQAHPAPRPEARPAPQPQERPAPAPRPQEHPAPRPEARPAPAPHVEAHPAPAPHPAAKPKPEDEHPR